MMSTKNLWILLTCVLVGAFLILGLFGLEIYRKAPPIPLKVVEGNQTLMTKEGILFGQQVWQSIGGQQVGSVWGHGAYQSRGLLSFDEYSALLTTAGMRPIEG